MATPLDIIKAWPKWRGSEVTPAVLEQMGSQNTVGTTTAAVTITSNLPQPFATYTIGQAELAVGDVLRLGAFGDYLNPVGGVGAVAFAWRIMVNGVEAIKYQPNPPSTEGAGARQWRFEWDAMVAATTLNGQAFAIVPALITAGQVMQISPIYGMHTDTPLDRSAVTTIELTGQHGTTEAGLECRCFASWLHHFRAA